MKKKLRAALLALMMVTALGTQAFAAQSTASYNFHFVPPFTGCLEITQPATRANSAYKPFVKPNKSSTATRYYLFADDIYLDGGYLPNATNYVDVSTAVKRTFTYKSGYGGTGTYYHLAGYPVDMNFSEYWISGTWGS
ncbi:MAG TPA: hypothetical protein H9691_07805 [Firmicutes bacterium]|nr:hypothetical protein [Bacillota bacterium]